MRSLTVLFVAAALVSAKVYSNRAACYAKLMDWERGLADCESCLKKDPTFVKAWLRKGKIHHFLKQGQPHCANAQPAAAAVLHSLAARAVSLTRSVCPGLFCDRVV